MYKTNVNCSVLSEYLGFLMERELVEERVVGRNRTVYAITERGVTVLKQFGELKRVLPIAEENERIVPPLF